MRLINYTNPFNGLREMFHVISDRYLMLHPTKTLNQGKHLRNLSIALHTLSIMKDSVKL